MSQPNVYSGRTGWSATRLHRMLRSPHQLLALWFGIGLSPVVPGTLGTLAGIGVYGLLVPLPLVIKLVIYVCLIPLACWACARTGRDLNDPDHNSIVIDEVLGMALVLEFIQPTPLELPLAFVLFRIFDTLKPWPIHLADETGKGGFYVVLDDLLASVWVVALWQSARVLWGSV